MENYSFRVVRADVPGPTDDTTQLSNRPFATVVRSFEEDASRFVPGERLETAINTAIAVGLPLLITGEPGTGKTQAAYYAAYKLGAEPVIPFQVKSDSSASDLLYHFDAVRLFRDAQLVEKGEVLDKSKYVEKRALWEALDSPTPRVLLIDEIDKAPRDFPNDLLLEIDKMEFRVPETGQMVRARTKSMRPVVFITSNSERRLPEPFLRRCVYHHLRFDVSILEKAIQARKDEYATLSDGFLALATQRFLALRDSNLRKRPSTGEFLVWLRVLALTTGTYPDKLESNLAKLPYLGTLLKDHQDIEELEHQSGG